MIGNCKRLARIVLSVLFFLGLFGVSPAIAATVAVKADKQTETAQKIHITSERLVSDSANNQAEFIGNVRATQGETQITADSLKIIFTSESAPGDASPAQSMEKLVASGNVEIKFDNRLAVARQAVYITAERVLILTGPDASVTSGDNTISGEKITFYRESGRFTVEGGSGGRVKAVILPDKASGLE